MEITLTPGNILALVAAMALLAAVPGISVLAVTARAAASGFRHGAVTALGIVAGDITFILLAVFGLSAAAGAMGGLFVLIEYLGGLYLIALGVQLWRLAPAESREPSNGTASSLLASFMTGLFITLGDQKAILFYLGFLPAFVDLTALTVADLAIIIGAATISLMGVKLVYAWFASRARAGLGQRAGHSLNRAAGGLLVLLGVCLLVKS